MYWKGKKGKKFPPIILCPRKLIHEIRLIKSSKDITMLEKAADITKRGFVKAMKESRPGMFEFQVQAIFDYEYRRLGSERDGYEHIVAAGENACVLHYVTNRKKIEENELILIDSGAEYGYFSADVTRTFPAGTKFTEPQKRVYNLVLKSQEEAIKMSKPGVNLEDIHKKVCEIICEGLKELGFFKFSSEAEIEKEKMWRRYFMHGTSHWLGMDVHDVGIYKIDGEPIPLEPGMVFTIEPGLYFDPHDKRVPEEYRGIGIRIEDDILITEAGNRNFTYMIPKTIEEIESLLNE
ncbi:MAG: Xaa-Pro dipeptidase [Planctomycetes bacterium]|nr:Xaa-Pro dipeptidase [Planctomycetota bacterium]